MAKKMYVGVDNVARTVNTAYVGVNNIAKKVKKAYIGVGGKARLFYASIPTEPIYYPKNLSFLYRHSRGGAVTNLEGNKIIAINNYYLTGDGRLVAEIINKNRIKTTLDNANGVSYIGFAASKGHAVFTCGYDGDSYFKTSIAYSFSNGVRVNLSDAYYAAKGITGSTFNKSACFGGGYTTSSSTKASYFRFDENLVLQNIETNVNNRTNGICMAGSNYGLFTCGGNAPENVPANIRNSNFVKTVLSGLPESRFLHGTNAVAFLNDILVCGGSSSTSTSSSTVNGSLYTRSQLYSIDKNFIVHKLNDMSIGGCPNANTNKIMAVISPNPVNSNILEIYNSKLIKTHTLTKTSGIQSFRAGTRYENFEPFFKCYLNDSIFFFCTDEEALDEIAFV